MAPPQVINAMIRSLTIQLAATVATSNECAIKHFGHFQVMPSEIITPSISSK